MCGHSVDPRCRMQDIGWRWGARRCSKDAGICRIVRKHDCAPLAQYPKHSNTRGLIKVRIRVGREVVMCPIRGLRPPRSVPQQDCAPNSADPCSQLCIDLLGSPGEMFRSRFIDVVFRMSTIHRAISVWIECSGRYRFKPVLNCVISGTVRALWEAQWTLRSYNRS